MNAEDDTSRARTQSKPRDCRDDDLPKKAEAAATMPRWRRWLFRMVAVGLGGVFAVGLVELGLRLVVPSSDSVASGGYLPGSLRQTVMGSSMRRRVYGVPFETNASGFRSQREYSREKPADAVRVIVIGDSFTAGAGVPFADICTTRLEKMIDEALPGVRVEVYNLAVGGHQIVHHLGTLKDVGLGYRPDLVLLFIYPANDFNPRAYDLSRSYIETHDRGQGLIVPPPSTRGWLRSLYVVRAFGPQLEAAARRIGVADDLAGPSAYEGLTRLFTERTTPWQRSFEALTEFGQLTREAGIPCQAFLLPANWRRYEDQQPVWSMAEQALREAGLNVVSLIDGFVAAGCSPHDLQLNLIDDHPSAEYNRIAAESVFDELRQAGLLRRMVERRRSAPPPK
ncbi:MAG: SGNH/GDSL hydrolase family protein [bacterium]|nr:SGNH/GDSL hydrolase family protein [bacterium]